MNNSERGQRILRYYRDQFGKDSTPSTSEVAAWAVKHGLLRLPPPVDPLTRVAEDLAKAWREELRRDRKTGMPYRANHAVTKGQVTIWGDIDEVPRNFMQAAFTQRREQIVGDCLQLSLDLDHYNVSHRNEKPLVVPLDFTDDVNERKLTINAA